jgi:Flp pilus assembly secretin CpaC
MQAPNATMFNGQEAAIQVCDQQLLTTSVHVAIKDGHPVFITQKEAVEGAGTKMSLLPVVSADKRFVRLTVNANVTSQNSEEVPVIPVTAPTSAEGKKCGEQPVVTGVCLQLPNFTTLTVDKTLTLPDGGSALLNMGTRVNEGKECFGPPVLSKIPYMNRLFKDVSCSKETERVLMVVTPRIVVADAEEARVAKLAGAFEEQEEPPTSAKKCEGCCEKCPQCCQAKAADIVEKYHKACAEGHGDEATKLAVQALAVDPMCFSKPCTAPTGKGR